jgi:hypothetical protein
MLMEKELPNSQSNTAIRLDNETYEPQSSRNHLKLENGGMSPINEVKVNNRESRMQIEILEQKCTNKIKQNRRKNKFKNKFKIR